MSSAESTRKVILDLAVTLDGFIEGPNGEVDWCIMEPDMDFPGFLKGLDAILYGRKSYELWGEYTPGGESSDFEKEIWGMVHSKKKYVFSTTLPQQGGKATLISRDITGEIHKMKQEPGKDIWLYGGANLIKTFMELGLIDVYRLSVHPVILGEGKPLFTPMKQRRGLRLIESRSFSSGVVQLCYAPIRNEE